MAVVVKNTFLDVADYKFLYSGESCGADKRSSSVPRCWKPATPKASGEHDFALVCHMTSSNDMSSPRSDVSFHSALESMERKSSSASALETSCWDVQDWGDVETDEALDCTTTPTSNLSSPRCEVTFALEGFKEFVCPTPTSPQNSPRCYMENMLDGDCWGQAPQGACYTTGHMLPLMAVCTDGAPEYCTSVVEDLSTGTKVDKAPKWFSDANLYPEPEDEPETLMENKQVPHCQDEDSRTRLKVEAPVFQPVPKDSRMEAIVSCVHLALFSSGQVCNIGVESSSLLWNSATVVTAEVPGGADAQSRSYGVMQLTKQALEAITERLPTVALLSARVQKEDSGYSLRSSIALLPEHAKNCMCWDMFRKGHCPRRSQCRWYHPQDSDIARIRVSIKYGQDANPSVKMQQLQQQWMNLSSSRPKISLGELVQ